MYCRDFKKSDFFPLFMPRVQYKEKCMKCRKNYVLTTNRKEFLVCYECQQKEMDKPINDPKMKKLFDIPEQFYKKSNFLRNIKINYLRYESLSEKQIEYFKKVVKELEDQSKTPTE